MDNLKSQHNCRLLTRVLALAISTAVFSSSSQVFAVRLMTNPPTTAGQPQLEFGRFALTPDSSTIVTVGLFDDSLVGQVVYTVPIPQNPATETVSITRILEDDFVTVFDSNGPPVVSPDGSSVLYLNDSRTEGEYTIHSLAIGGGDGPLNGIFTGSTGNNNVGTGFGNFDPRYSPDGNTIFFINSESGFNGSVPDFSAPGTPGAWGSPDWDQLYSVPASGGTPTAITSPADGDIDDDLWAITPNGNSIVYAPDNPVREVRDRGTNRPKLFSVPTAGGSSTEIPLVAPAHATFTIRNQLEITPDGNNIVFVGDYEMSGKFELYSVPITGGTPIRVSDDLPLGGDVSSFAISPDGTKVAYAAGQNLGANRELFLKSFGGAAGSSIRVSDPLSQNGGQPDVFNDSGKGVVAFSSNNQILYLADTVNNDVFDIHVVDTTEKVGLIPSAYTFVGPPDGDFFDENNWQDAQGNAPPANTINPDAVITHSLIIDGDTVGSSGGQVDFGTGASLELTPGSVLNLLNPGDQLDVNFRSALKITDATINVDDDVYLQGGFFLTGGMIRSFNDDIEFDDDASGVASGTTFVAGDNIIVDNSFSSISNATFQAADQLGIRYTSQFTVTDTNISVGNGANDIDDVFTGDAAEGAVITLRGTSTLEADSIAEGVDLVLEDSAIATFGSLDADMTSDNRDEAPFFAFESKIIVNSLDAELILSLPTEIIQSTLEGFDARPFIINGLSGLSYADDPSAWNVTDWNGTSALSSLKLVSTGGPGDFNGDGDVDGQDFLAWQRGESPNPLSTSDLSDWESAYGSAAVASSTQIPEPGSFVLLGTMAFVLTSLRRRHSLTGKPGKVCE